MGHLPWSWPELTQLLRNERVTFATLPPALLRGSAPESFPELETLIAYSPCAHVKPGTNYPSLLMMSADHDDRVDPFHARKFTALVQAASPSTVSWLRIEANAGHGGSDQVAKAIESSADQVAFLMSQLGLENPVP